MAGDDELTIDQLAARVGMTVRNVRAYAGRGILPPPRLVGRTGYYNREHVNRLSLVRELLDRGLTLAAVEQTLREARPRAAGHTLDLLHLLDTPHDVDVEVMSRDDLAALAGIDRDDPLIAAMEDYGLIRMLEDDQVELVQPMVVRVGSAAAALGLAPATLIELYPLMRSRLRVIAEAFVSAVVTEIVEPFLEREMPDDGWEPVMAAIEELLPISGQVTVAILRAELGAAIDREITTQLSDGLRPRTRSADGRPG